MLKICNWSMLLGLLLCLTTTPASAEVRIGIGLPHVNIRLNLPLFPELVLVPGSPVYYAPRLDANYFFYDGLYWVYLDDNWYASDWYNGPWWLADPDIVPLFILRTPVRYYRQPPPYFRDWRRNEPPRWNNRWGKDWEHRHRGWDRSPRHAKPAPAPLPDYQRGYDGKHYPRGEVQQQLHNQHYRYQPRDATTRKHFAPGFKQPPSTSPPRGRQPEPQLRQTDPRRDDRRTQQPQNYPPGRYTPAAQPTRQPQRAPVLRGPSRNQPSASQHQERENRQQGDDRRTLEREGSQGYGRGGVQGPGQSQGHGRD